MKQVWTKVILFSATLFLIRLADGVISFWAPNEIQNFLGSSVMMGLIISFQSVIGFLADLIFPFLLKTTKVRKMIFWAILASLATSLLLVSASVRPFIGIFLVTMGIWGIYYELVTFANYQFMGSSVPGSMRVGAWGIMGIFTNMAYFLGPLIAAEALLRGSYVTEIIIVVFLLTAFILLSVTGKSHDSGERIDLRRVNPVAELGHWFSLIKHIWPATVMSIMLGCIDATFWTTGAVWTGKLVGQSPLGGLFLPFYQLPSMFLGVLVVKWGIRSGKKRLVQWLLILTGGFLTALAYSDSIYWQLAMVFLSASVIAVSYPLLEGVYTDIVARMGKEKKHMIGLTSSALNIAFIIWPPVAGYLVYLVGERRSFSVLGIMVIAVSVFLLFVTPKKLKFPQEEIKSWQD